jgi:hypothetical protein
VTEHKAEEAVAYLSLGIAFHLREVAVEESSQPTPEGLVARLGL